MQTRRKLPIGIQTFRLNGINLIAGKNNSGKTSLLEATFLLSEGGNAQVP